MIQSVEDIIEPRLRDAGYLGASEKVDVFQYAYNSSVGASAGTHSGGGALDHDKGSDGETKIWRECGVADWQRGSPEDSAFDDHNHGIWQGCPHLSDDAYGQIAQYESGCNGLADWGADQSPNVAPITWQDAYDKYKGKGGVLGMTELTKWSRGKDQTVTNDGEWHLLKIADDDSLSILTGPASFIVYSGYQLQKIAAGDVAQFRYVRVFDYPDGGAATTTESDYPIHETAGTSGDTYDEIVFVNSIGDNAPSNGKEKIRLYAKAPSTAPMTVASLTIRCMHD